MEPIRVFLLWEAQLQAETLVEALASRREISLVGASNQLPRAVAWLQRRESDVVLLEASGEGGPRPLRALKESVPGCRILPFALATPRAAVRFLEAGACGYVPIGSEIEDLVRAIDGVHREKPFCDLDVAILAQERIRELSSDLDPSSRVPSGADLTQREREVLERLARGLTNKEVAHSLSIQTSTVKNHVHNLVRKLRVRNRREAVRQAFDSGLLV